MPMMPMAYDNCTVQFAYRTTALDDMRRQTLGMGAAQVPLTTRSLVQRYARPSWRQSQ
jgi:hypothetical protein